MVVGLAYMNKTHVLVIAFANLTNKPLLYHFVAKMRIQIIMMKEYNM